MSNKKVNSIVLKCIHIGIGSWRTIRGFWISLAFNLNLINFISLLLGVLQKKVKYKLFHLIESILPFKLAKEIFNNKNYMICLVNSIQL